MGRVDGNRQEPCDTQTPCPVDSYLACDISNGLVWTVNPTGTHYSTVSDTQKDLSKQMIAPMFVVHDFLDEIASNC